MFTIAIAAGATLMLLASALPAAAGSGSVEPFQCRPSQGDLAASLYLPAGEPTFVAIVDVGAKKWDRWGNTADVNYGHYGQLAEGLQAGGMAVLLYDKRGTGASPGALGDMAMRVRDSESMSTCMAERLPGVGQIRIGHSAGSVVVSTAPSPRAGTVLLSPVVPKERWPKGPVLALRGGADPHVTEGIVVEGADHLLMRDGKLAPEVVERIVAWSAGLSR